MNRKIFVDTDAFIALVKKDDSLHQKATLLLGALTTQPVHFLTSAYVLSECITVLSMRVSHQAAIQFIETIKAKNSRFSIEQIDDALEERAIEIFKKQHSKNTSFVDCTNMALIEKLKIDSIFSFDEVYRKNGITMLDV